MSLSLTPSPLTPSASQVRQPAVCAARSRALAAARRRGPPAGRRRRWWRRRRARGLVAAQRSAPAQRQPGHALWPAGGHRAAQLCCCPAFGIVGSAGTAGGCWQLGGWVVGGWVQAAPCPPLPGSDQVVPTLLPAQPAVLRAPPAAGMRPVHYIQLPASQPDPGFVGWSQVRSSVGVLRVQTACHLPRMRARQHPPAPDRPPCLSCSAPTWMPFR